MLLLLPLQCSCLIGRTMCAASWLHVPCLLISHSVSCKPLHSAAAVAAAAADADADADATTMQVLEWKDYVRGKDLAKWLRERQQLLDQHTRPQSTSEQAFFITHFVILSYTCLGKLRGSCWCCWWCGSCRVADLACLKRACLVIGCGWLCWLLAKWLKE
jgi:hypothetical protein